MYIKYYITSLFLGQEPFQHEGKKIGNRIELSVKAYVPVGELYSVSDIGKFVVSDELIQRSCCAVVCFDLNRDKGV